jgi:hypothetical protein
MGLRVTSLMVDLLQNVTAHLTRAVNDQGPLGILTRFLLLKRTTYLGGMQTLNVDRDRQNTCLLGLTSHFHLANQ